VFDTNVSRDEVSKKRTRRVFIAGAATVMAAYAAMRIFGSRGMEASVAIHGTPGVVTIVNFSNDGTNLGSHTVPKVVKTDGAWYRQLGRNSFGITRQADTEIPFTGATWKEHGRGLIAASVATRRCSAPRPSLNPAQAGQASGHRWRRKISPRRPTSPSDLSAPK
jgi:peptide-methionine (R)-S-oxide reductase